MQNRKLKVWLPLLLSVMIVVGMIIGFSIKNNMPSRGIFYTERPQSIQEVIDLVDSKYVDSVNNDTLRNTAISGILSKLDPHSVYLPVEEVQQVKEEIQGHFYGIGIEYNIYDDTINVLNVLPGGPSDRAGVKIGDRLIKVEDSSIIVHKIGANEIRKRLRGKEGSLVKLTILRDGALKNISVKREGIPLYSVDAAYMISPAIGYIKLNKFSETTYKEFMQATEKLQKQGMKNMILDLRDNGGGILTEATDIADEFLDGDKLITYTVGVHSPKKEYRCKREGIFEKGKVMVLVNEGTASASEVLIGALQDWDRATIIGRRTFGKGLVQEQYDLSNGAGLRLTVARYYTPLGRSIQKSYSGGNSDYKDELKHRMEDGEFVSADSIKHQNATAYKTPGGKTVYSSGGITPDIFVAFDTAGYSRELAKVFYKQDVLNYAYRNYQQNKTQLAPYNTPEAFNKQFTFSDKMWNDFKAFLKKDSINIDGISSSDKDELLHRLKELYAQQKWQMEGMYEVMNSFDPVFKKAVEILNK